ncbi:MAG: pantetheine-phosphate adenylyltransferase [Mailhella sp.]|nr:pantetheine-phosphate adenylyltransferase [Mailhella sp.]
MTKHSAVYPGTFDPLTNGHCGIIRRGTSLFDSVIVAVARETGKKTLFSLDERVAMARESLAGLPNVTVEPFDGLLVDYVRSVGAVAILRGLRAVSDFDYELQMALMNRKLCRDVQTVFLMSDFQWMYISSTTVRGVASLGGNVRGLVPDAVLPHLRKAYGLPEVWPQDPVT